MDRESGGEPRKIPTSLPIVPPHEAACWLFLQSDPWGLGPTEVRTLLFLRTLRNEVGDFGKRRFLSTTDFARAPRRLFYESASPLPRVAPASLGGSSAWWTLSGSLATMTVGVPPFCETNLRCSWCREEGWKQTVGPSVDGS